MADYTISGLQPKRTGGEWEHGDSWFLFDESGAFSVDKDIKARIYLVGGGCKGEDGGYESSTGTRFGGKGGDGGYVSPELKITIPKNTDCVVNIAAAKDQSGTSLDISGNVFECNTEGSTKRVGGYGGFYRTSDNQSYAEFGVEGILTPYGYVGSSGSGGGLAGGAGAGTPATNYGCGGSGGKSGSGKGSEGQGGCVIVCVISDVEIPNELDLTYNGLEQYPFGENGIKGVKITEDFSATLAGEYTSYLHLESDDLCWSDGTRRVIERKWRINPIKIKKPDVWKETVNADTGEIEKTYYTGEGTLSYDYDGHAPIYNECWKLPFVETEYAEGKKYSDVLDITGTGLTKQYKANTYPISFVIKHPDSCSWITEDEDEIDTEDYNVSWTINPIEVDIPKVTSKDFTYSGQSYGINQTAEDRKVIVENYDPKIMTQSGHTGSYSGAGNYYLTYTLRDPDSCSWKDENGEISVTPKTVYWNILKQEVYLDKPYLAEDQKKFTYNGTAHTPVITNRDDNKMSVKGTVSSVAANNADKPFWEINIALKTAANYIYKWNVEDEDKQTKEIVLKWVVNKGSFKVPKVSPEHMPFNGKTQSVTVTGLDSKVMIQSGTTSGKVAGKYDLVYSLKDRDSAEWELTDGSVTTENQTVSWWIDVSRVPVPLVSDTEKRVSWGTSGNSVYLNSQSPTIEGYDTHLMSKSGDTGNYPGDYTLRFCLLDTESSTWDDEEYTTDCKEFPWAIKKEVVYYPKPYLDPEYPQFDYDGKTHTVTLKNYLNTYSSGNYTYSRKHNQNALRYLTKNKSGINAEDYTITVEVCENSIFDFQWNDGTKDSVELNWKINKNTFPKPDISSRVYKFTNKKIAITEINYNSDVMERVSGSVISATNDGDYSVTYRLKDKESASWDDGTTDDITIPWKIVALIDEADALEVPSVTDTEFVYNKNRHAPTISEYDVNLIGIRTTSTTSAINANAYVITFYLKAPGSSCWKDGTIEDKRFTWVINKAVEKFEKPTLDPNTIKYPYNGFGQHPTVLGVDSSVMTVNNPYIAEAGKHTVTVSLKTHQNYEYQWMDGTNKPVELDWEISKIAVVVPTISQDLFYYGAYASGYHFISHAWRQPEIMGYDPKIMNSVGVTNLHAFISNEWGTGVKTEVTGKYYGNYQWALGKYYIEFTFKHPNSGEWINGETNEKLNVEKIIYEWSIVREIKLLEKPYLNSDNSTFEYDGTEKTPLITNGTNAEGVIVDGDTNATAAGDYTIECKPHIPKKVTDVYDYRWSDNSVDTIPLSWDITKGTAQIPTLKLGTESFFYDGEPHIPIIENLDENKVSVQGYYEKTALSEYTITFSLKDTSSCAWTDGSVDIKTVTWYIVKQKFKKPTITPDFMQYDGEEHTIEFVDNQKDHSFVVDGFDTNTMNYSGDLKKTNVGEYEVVISLKDTNSACWEDDSTDPVKLPWEIRKKIVLLDKPYLTPIPTEYIFDGEQHRPTIELWKNHGMYVKDGSTRFATSAEKYKITVGLVEDNNITYLWGDAVENAVGGDIELNWEIKKAVGEYGIPKPTVTNLEFDYNGQEHVPTVSGYNSKLMSAPGASGTFKAANAGEYEIRFSLIDKESSEWLGGGTEDIVYKWKINRARVKFSEKPKLVPTSYTFDTKNHLPEMKNYDSNTMSRTGYTEKSAAKSYTVTVSVDKNHAWHDGTFGNITLEWEIEKLVLKKPHLESDTFTYNGLEQSPNVADFNEKYMEKSGDRSKTPADSYTAVISLIYPDSCVWEGGVSDPLNLEWTIKKLALKKPYLDPITFTYNGLEQSPSVIDWVDNVMLRSGDIKKTAKGEYKDIISLIDKNSSYWDDGSVEDIELPWEIIPYKFDKPTASPLEFTYNEQEQAPVIENFNPDVMSLIGTAKSTNAGDYTITFRLKDKDSGGWNSDKDNDTEDVVFDWVIKQIEVEKPYLNKTKFTYNAGTHKPTVKNVDSLLFTVSGDMEASAVGKYHIYAYLNNTENYKWKDGVSNRLDLPWEITKIPVDKPKIEPDEYPYTGKRIDAVVKGFRSLAMQYRSDSERYGITIGEYKIFVQLNENYAWSDETEDDLELVWNITKVTVKSPSVENLLFIYDGTPHSPKISDYDTNMIAVGDVTSAVNANDYQITFSLKDKEHCEWDIGGSDKIVVDWKIAKKMLSKPKAITTHFVYNGGWHLPVIDNIAENYMRFEGTNRETNAGSYFYKIILKDKINCVYDDGTNDDIVIPWDIGRKPVEVPYLDPDEFKYNGKYRTPVIRNFNKEIMEITPYSQSTTSARDVDSYHISITIGRRISNGSGGYTYLRNWEWKTGGVANLVLYWKIVRAALPYPVLTKGELVYNGKSQSPVVGGYNSEIMGAVGTGSETDVGNYKIGFYIRDAEKYEWADGVADRKMLDWKIIPAKLDKTQLPKQDPVLVFNGYSQTPTWDSRYSAGKYVVDGDISERNVGKYYADFSPSSNYTWLDGTRTPVKVEWEIIKAGIKDPVQSGILYYNGKEQTPLWDFQKAIGLATPQNGRRMARVSSVSSIYDIEFSGETEGVNVDEYYVTCTCDSNVYFISTGTNTCDASWEISKFPLKAPSPEKTYLYTGETITPVFKDYDPDILTISGKTEGIDVGDYSAYFDINDKDNYTWASGVYVNALTRKVGVTWKIVNSAKKAYIPYQNNWLIYNGNKQSPFFANYDSSLMLLVGGVPSKTNAGTYNVTFSLKSNVVWEDGTVAPKTVKWKIDKRKYNFPRIKTSEATGGMYYYQIEGKRYPIWANYVPEIMIMSGEFFDIDNSWHTTYFDLKDPLNYAWEDGESDTYAVQWKLSEAYDPTRVPGTGDKKVYIPKQIRVPYEDGTTKYPNWNRFDDTAIMKVGGKWEGVNADTYYVILELRDGYVWEDGTVEIKEVPWKILSIGEPKPDEPDPIVIHIPEQINIPYYNGYVKEPEWDDWDKFGIDVVKGDLYGVLAGGYSLVLRPQTGYVWEDGKAEDKTVVWVINPRKEIEIPDDDVPKNPFPEKGDDDNTGRDNRVCCCGGFDTGLFNMLNSCDCDDGIECDCGNGEI